MAAWPNGIEPRPNIEYFMKIRLWLYTIALASALCGCGSGGDDPSIHIGRPAPRLMQVAPAAKAPGIAGDYKDVVQQIYVAYFGRPADADGLGYYEALFLAANAPTT
jgi:hypothetical protein